jgi:hypothetical protein
MNKAIKILLIVLACLALSLVVGYIVSNAPPQEQPPSNNSSGPADRVEVVYFHRTQRCHTCIHAEELTRYTVETYFSDELASGKLTFQSIDVQDSKNAAMINKFGAYGSQLFINTIRDGIDHIEQTTDLYPLINNDQAFVTALKTKIEKSLKGEA